MGPKRGPKQAQNGVPGPLPGRPRDPQIVENRHQTPVLGPMGGRDMPQNRAHFGPILGPFLDPFLDPFWAVLKGVFLRFGLKKWVQNGPKTGQKGVQNTPFLAVF